MSALKPGDYVCKVCGLDSSPTGCGGKGTCRVCVATLEVQILGLEATAEQLAQDERTAITEEINDGWEDQADSYAAGVKYCLEIIRQRGAAALLEQPKEPT